MLGNSGACSHAFQLNFNMSTHFSSHSSKQVASPECSKYILLVVEDGQSRYLMLMKPLSFMHGGQTSYYYIW